MQFHLLLIFVKKSVIFFFVGDRCGSGTDDTSILLSSFITLTSNKGSFFAYLSNTDNTSSLGLPSELAVFFDWLPLPSNKSKIWQRSVFGNLSATATGDLSDFGLMNFLGGLGSGWLEGITSSDDEEDTEGVSSTMSIHSSSTLSFLGLVSGRGSRYKENNNFVQC